MHDVKRAPWRLLVVALMLALLAGCATQTSYDNAANFVEPSEVLALMESGAAVLDARGAEAYAKGHLDGALCLPPKLLTADVEPDGMVASAEQVAAQLSELGIGNKTLVLVYDDKGGVYAGRIWWVLRHYGHSDVKIINGGARGLEKAGLPMSAAKPVVEKSQYQIVEDGSALLATIDDVQAIAEGNSDAKLIDVRSAAEFAEGYIATAINIPHTENLYSDGTFKSKRVIEMNYADKGLAKDDAIVLYCKTSFRATQTAALLLEAGYQDVRIYDGAWLEWQSRGMQPAEVPQEEVKPSEEDGS